MGDVPVGWSDEDEARFTLEALPAWHPSLFVDVFRTALTVDPSDLNPLLSGAFITPESIESWGDFSRARAALKMGLKISMTPLYAEGAPDVAYVRLVETDQHINPSISQVPATMHVTLVWRPEIAVVPGSSWRIHHLGEPLHPSLLPRTAPGIDPRRGTGT